MKVPLLDLKAQYESIKNKLNEALLKTAETQFFILGPEVERFEGAICEYLNCKHAIGVSSGTDALLIALMAIDIRAGDEVIVPTYSFFATAGVVSRLNAIPVFCDSDNITFNIDPQKIESLITPKTKAIIPVHLYGQSAEMDVILEIARKNNLKVIEDAAQAIGAQYEDGKFCGTIGDIGCFSFFPSKNLGCFGDGGIVVTNDEKLADKLKILRVHGSEPKYYHKVIGGNFRLDALQAGVLNVKLPYLNGWSAKRRENAELYNRLFIEKGLAEEAGRAVFDVRNSVLLPKAVYKDSGALNYHIYNQYVIRVEKRDELRKFLQSNDIGTEIYYPVPFHRQECYADRKLNLYDYPVADFCADKSLALPVYPELRSEQIQYVVDTIAKF
ncbi:MAG: DegT/DnrJ/EryC1/StrS family aminotransferase [Ignavibacteriae bacterium]|nr:DegT/DnrJ/EryC1/StrS family aminotransferase [Ignavibacteriota bacterium]